MQVRCVLIFLLLTACIRVTAQDMKLPVKVIIDYVVGGNSWGQPGIYSREERFEFLPVRINRFKITKYLKINRIAGEGGRTIARVTTEMRVYNLSSVSIRKIDSLYIQLHTTKDNFNTAFIKPHLIKPTEQQILAVARKYDKYYKFEDDERSERKEKVDQMRNFAKLDTFIKLNKPDPGILVLAVDEWDSMSVSYIYRSDTIKYVGDFYKLLAQPIQLIPAKHADFVNGTVNLEINLLVESMVPKSSLLRKQIGLNSLTEAYIHWYIDKML